MFTGIILSLGFAFGLFLQSNSTWAADGRLTNQIAHEALWKYFQGKADKVKVIGVLERPQQNQAKVNISIYGWLLRRPRNDAVTAYVFGPGGETFKWSGRGSAVFVHYNDGRWVLNRIVTEMVTLDNLNIVVNP